METERNAAHEAPCASQGGGRRAWAITAARMHDNKAAGVGKVRGDANAVRVTNIAPHAGVGAARSGCPGCELNTVKTGQQGGGCAGAGSKRRRGMEGETDSHRGIVLRDEVPLGRTFKARCGNGLGRTETYYVGHQKDVGVTGLRTWPRGSAGAPAFKKGETVAYFVERTRGTKGVGVIEGRGRIFEYDQERSTAFRINTTIRGHGRKAVNTDLGKAPCRAKVDGRTYWRVFATKDIQYGEALRIPYRDKRHVAQIKNEIQQKQSQVMKSNAAGQASKARAEKRRQWHAHLAALNAAKREAAAVAKRGAREHRKRERSAKWQSQQRLTRSRTS